MKDERRPQGMGTCMFKQGRGWIVRWRRYGQGDITRRVASKREGERVLHEVERLEREGEPLPVAVRKALGRPSYSERTPAEALTMARLIDLFVDSENPKEPRRFHRLQKAPWAEDPIGSYPAAAVHAWVIERKSAGLSGGTIRNALNAASAVFRWGQRLELIDAEAVNVFARARSVMGTVQRKDRTALDAGELHALAREVSATLPEFDPVFLALLTGWRLMEVCSLTWADVDLTGEPGWMECPAEREKMKRTKRVALPRSLRDSLVGLREQEGPRVGLVFIRPAYRNWPAGSWQTTTVVPRLRKAMRACVERNEIPEAKLTGDDRTMPFDAHSLRHSVRSILHAAGHDSTAIGAALGHESADSRKRYTHALDTGLERLAAEMDRTLEPDAQAEGNTA